MTWRWICRLFWMMCWLQFPGHVERSKKQHHLRFLADFVLATLRVAENCRESSLSWCFLSGFLLQLEAASPCYPRLYQQKNWRPKGHEKGQVGKGPRSMDVGALEAETYHIRMELHGSFAHFFCHTELQSYSQELESWIMCLIASWNDIDSNLLQHILI